MTDTPFEDKPDTTDRFPSQVERPRHELGPGQLDTPLLPASLPREDNRRATLTVLTGLQAGRLVSLDRPQVIIGRAADADLVVDETGVSRHHARVARNLSGGFYVEDLGS